MFCTRLIGFPRPLKEASKCSSMKLELEWADRRGAMEIEPDLL